jgi:hypothetical protein
MEIITVLVFSTMFSNVLDLCSSLTGERPSFRDKSVCYLPYRHGVVCQWSLRKYVAALKQSKVKCLSTLHIHMLCSQSICFVFRRVIEVTVVSSIVKCDSRKFRYKSISF